MKPSSLAAWPSTLPEISITGHSSNTRRNRLGAIKLVSPPEPPDEETVRRLNELAKKNPFCTCHKVKKHETL